MILFESGSYPPNLDQSVSQSGGQFHLRLISKSVNSVKAEPLTRSYKTCGPHQNANTNTTNGGIGDDGPGSYYGIDYDSRLC